MLARKFKKGSSKGQLLLSKWLRGCILSIRADDLWHLPMDRPPGPQPGPPSHDIAAWMENLRMGPGPGPGAFLPAYPPAAAAPFSSYAAAEWHAARSVPGLAPGYLQPAQAELFTAQDLLAAGTSADHRSEGKGEEGEDYEPGAEGEGKTRSKMQEKNRRVRSRASQRTAPPGCLKQPGVVGQAKAVGGHQHDDMSLSHPLVQGMPCSWGVCRARAPSPRRARLARGPRLRRGFTLHRAARRAGAEALPRAPEDQGCGADGGHACAGAEALP